MNDNRDSVTCERARAAMRAEMLPSHLSVPARRLHRDVWGRLRDMDLAVEHGRDSWMAEDLRRATAGLWVLLALHLPDYGLRCAVCRGRWGRASRWPCHVWRTAHHRLGECSE